MKQIKNSIAVIILFGLVASCNKAPKADKAEAEEVKEVVATNGDYYKVAPKSLVTWKGTSIDGGHTGTFKVSEGVFTVSQNAITGGKFILDINSLDVLEIKVEDGKADLEGHLKSPDFFDVAKYPTATFEITSVILFQKSAKEEVLLKDATHIINGNFMLKGVSKNISIPAKITVDKNIINVTTEFNIDRSQWGLNYKGQDNPKDWIISKIVTIKFAIEASK